MGISVFGIIFIIIIVIGVIDTRNENTKFSFSRPDNRKEIDESIAYLRNKRPVRLGKYQPDERLYDEFRYNLGDEAVLSRMAADILRHLGLAGNRIPVYVVDDLEGRAAGRYMSNAYGSSIEIKVQKYTRPNEVMAVLIHECMHYYLRLTGLGFEDEHKNEILTDTATIYFGLYDYIYSGYIHVGYIKDSEIKYINRVLSQG